MTNDQTEMLARECMTALNRLRERFEITGAVLLVDFNFNDEIIGSVQQFVGSPSVAYGLCRRFAVEQESLWGEQAIVDQYEDMEEEDRQDGAETQI